MVGCFERPTCTVLLPVMPYFPNCGNPKCHRAGACVTLTAFERHTVDATRDSDSLDTPRSSETCLRCAHPICRV